jgi:hypothetical protein
LRSERIAALVGKVGLHDRGRGLDTIQHQQSVLF